MLQYRQRKQSLFTSFILVIRHHRVQNNSDSVAYEDDASRLSASRPLAARLWTENGNKNKEWSETKKRVGISTRERAERRVETDPVSNIIKSSARRNDMIIGGAALVWMEVEIELRRACERGR